VGSEQDYPPFATGMTDAEAGGFTVDLWKAVAAEVGLEYRIRVRPFRQILGEFKNGEINLLINLAYSDERKQFVDFTIPHVIVHGAIFVRKNRYGIRSEKELAGKSIIVLNADLAHDYALSKGWGKNLVLVDTAAEGMRLLASGKHDAMLLGKLTGMQALRALKISNIEALKAKVGFSQKFAFAVPKGQAELLGRLNEGLSIVKSNGTYNELYEKWFGIYEEHEVDFEDLLSYLIPVLALFMLFALYVLYRRNRDQAQAERTLRISNQRFETVLAALPDLMFELNKEGKYMSVWGGRNDLLVAPENRLLGRCVHDVMPKVAADEVLLALAEADSIGYSFGCEIKLNLPQGEHWFELSVAKQPTDPSQEAVFIVLSRDISQRKRDESLVRHSEERFRLILENTPIAVRVTLIDSNQVIFANKPYKKLLGTLPSQPIGLDPAQVYANPKDYEEVLAKIAKGEQVTDKLVELRTQDEGAQEKWVLASYLPVEFQNEQAILSWYYDISQRMRTEQNRLLQMEVQRNALVREVHHRIKNNLQGIIGLLNLEAEQHPIAADIIANVSAKLKSVAVVFGLQGQCDDDTIYLHEVIGELCESAQKISQLQLSFEISEYIQTPMLVDKNKAVAIALIVNELITNAIKHNSGGAIQLTLSADDASSTLHIVNTCLTPVELNWESGIGLGTGLNLVKLMLPPEAAHLSLNVREGVMDAELTLTEPIIIRQNWGAG
jgi:PAS domain S-box-containing protein